MRWGGLGMALARRLAARRGRRLLPGLLVALAIALLARRFLDGRAVPAVVGALVAGAALANLLPLAWARPGAAIAVRWILRLAIICLGAGLDLGLVSARGGATAVLIVVLVALAMLLGVTFGRAASLDRRVALLIGAGTAICGASAIMTLAPVVRARDGEAAYALATVFTFNIAALLVFPLIGHHLALDATQFGSWAGTAVNDTSVVVATGYAYSPQAGAVATLVKLARTVLLVPLVVGVGIALGGDRRGQALTRARRAVPWFVVGFLLLAITRTSGRVPVPAMNAVAGAGTFLIVVVLAAVGLQVDLRALARMGWRPLVVGFALATTMAAASLGLVLSLHLA